MSLPARERVLCNWQPRGPSWLQNKLWSWASTETGWSWLTALSDPTGSTARRWAGCRDTAHGSTLLLLQTAVLLICSSSYKTWWMVISLLNSKADFQTASLLRFYDFVRKEMQQTVQFCNFILCWTGSRQEKRGVRLQAYISWWGTGRRFCKNHTTLEKKPSFSLSFHLSPAKRVRSDQLLNRLPKVFIKDGHVINIRNSLRDTLQVTNS